jgi:cob(I)alamin adenosyltransferase
MNTDGLVQVYTGDGKGKTTTALGLGFRAAGHGLNVCMIQFLKGAHYLGELESARKVKNFKIFQFGAPCPWSKDMNKGIIHCGSCRYCFTIHEDDKRKAKIGMEFAMDAVKSGDYDVVILDEINVAMDRKVVPVSDVIDLIKNKGKKVELVLTGRNAPKEIIEVANLVTEMKDVKHPFAKGVEARVGIDF